MKKKLTKEEIRDILKDKLDILVDRMYGDDFELNLESEAAYEFAELSLTAHKTYESLDGYDAERESIVITGDKETTPYYYNEFETRQHVRYRFNKGQSVLTLQDKIYYTSGGKESVNYTTEYHLVRK